MALMSSGDSASGAIGTGQDPANPSAGGRRPDNLQSAVYGTEYANPERWGPAMPPRSDAPNTAANEATENYVGGDRQPQMKEVDLGAGGLRADTVAQPLNATDRGDVMLSRERPMIPDRTWEGQNGSGAVGSSATSGAGGGRGGYKSGTDLIAKIAQGGVRAGGMIPLPAHINSTSPDQRGPAS
jgi:hypothetical protein